MGNNQSSSEDKSVTEMIESDDQVEKPKTEEEELFPAAELLLGTAQKEYEYAFARKTAIETRTGILIPIIIGLLTFIMTNLKLKQLFNLKVDKDLEVILILLYGALGMLIILTTIVTLFYMIRVFLTYEYETVDTNELVAHTKKGSDYMANVLLKLYAEINEHNYELDKNKTKYYHNGIIAMAVLFITSLCFYTLLQFL